MFIYVYRLAIDARPKRGDGVAGRKYPSLLEGFPDGHIINGSPEASCINRKGFLMFLSYTQYPQAYSFYPFNPSNPRVTHCPGIGIFCLAEFVALKEEVSQQVGRKEAK